MGIHLARASIEMATVQVPASIARLVVSMDQARVQAVSIKSIAVLAPPVSIRTEVQVQAVNIGMEVLVAVASIKMVAARVASIIARLAASIAVVAAATRAQAQAVSTIALLAVSIRKAQAAVAASIKMGAPVPSIALLISIEVAAHTRMGKVPSRTSIRVRLAAASIGIIPHPSPRRGRKRR